MSDTSTPPAGDPTNPTDPVADPVADPGAAPEAGTLMVADVEQAVNIIDHACEQGAFKGWKTIEAVYTTRQRLANFVLRVKPATESPDGSDATPSAADAGEPATPAQPAPPAEPPVRSASLTGAAAKATV